MQKERILRVLPRRVRALLEGERLQYARLQEIRLRIDKPLLLIYGGKERIIRNQRDGPYIVTREDIREMVEIGRAHV